MARIWIKDGSIKVSVSGKDPRTATDPDDFLLNTDLLPDQILMAGAVAFGSGDSASVTLPSTFAEYKVDFFYCVLSSGVITQTMLPDNPIQKMEINNWMQLLGEFSGGNLVFTRRGNIAGQANRGVRYIIYATGIA